MSPKASTSVEVAEIARSTAREAEARAREIGRPVLASTGFPIERAEPLGIPSAAPPGTACGWWSEPGLVAAGSDVAVVVQGDGPDPYPALAHDLEAWFADAVVTGREPVAFAGGTFSGPPGERWRSFPNAAAWVPALAYIEDAAGVWLVASTIVFAGDSEAAAEHLTATLATGKRATTGREGPPSDRGDERPSSRRGKPAAIRFRAEGAGWDERVRDALTIPDDGAWDAAVRNLLVAVEAGTVTKVVLARQREHVFVTNPWAAAAAFSAEYPECFGFAASFGEAVLVGASPELLVRRLGRTVESTPTAGTVRRGAPGLDDPKILSEHRIVADVVEAALSPLCTTVGRETATRRAAGPVEHLASRITGELRGSPSALELVAVLHPTPAVAGLPVEEALDAIGRYEPFSRGWYAGPIGIVHPGGDGTFALALRCALVGPNTTTLYAGAGIVAGSDPAAERTEIDLKLRAAEEALRRAAAGSP